MTTTLTNAKVGIEQGALRGYVASGGSFDVESGGEIDVESGGALKLAGTNVVNQLSRAAVPSLVTQADNFTLTADDNGKAFLITGVDKVATLPATALGLRFLFIVAAAALSAGTGFSISPVAADKIMGNAFTSADDKDAINSGATDAEGDLLEITGDGAAGWYITRVIGTWARQA